MILGLDTATERLHLAMVDGDCSWTRAIQAGIGKSHSTALMPSLGDMIAEAGRGPDALKGVVCCVGPGGFTALRIGVATAEGLALTGLPTWGFSAFAFRARALHLRGLGETCWILLDGQRNEVFAQAWSDRPLDHAHKVPFTELQALVGSQFWWAPEGFRSKIAEHLNSKPFVLADEEQASLDALVSLCKELPARPPEAPLIPFYLRETDAEVNFPEASVHLPDELRKGMRR